MRSFGRQSLGAALLMVLLALNGSTAAAQGGDPRIAIRSLGERHLAPTKFCPNDPATSCTLDYLALAEPIRVRAGGSVRFALSRPAESFGIYDRDSSNGPFGRLVRGDPSGRYWTLRLPGGRLRRRELGLAAEFKDGNATLGFTIVPDRR